MATRPNASHDGVIDALEAGDVDSRPGGARGRRWATRRPPHVKGQKSQTRALHRVVDRLELVDSSRAVLRVICEMADGAGFCWPSVNRLIRESGYTRRSIYRALDDLEQRGYLDRYPQLRDPARYGNYLPQRARQGQGTSIYRVGETMRAAAGLRYVDVVEHLRLRSRGAQIGSAAPPDEAAVAFPDPSPARNSYGTPELHPQRDPQLPANTPLPEGEPCHPSTRNGKPLTEEKRLVPGTREQVLRSRGATLRTTSEIVAALPKNEALVVIEAEALVDAGGAVWVELGWSS